MQDERSQLAARNVEGLGCGGRLVGDREDAARESHRLGAHPQFGGEGEELVVLHAVADGLHAERLDGNLRLTSDPRGGPRIEERPVAVAPERRLRHPRIAQVIRHRRLVIELALDVVGERHPLHRAIAGRVRVNGVGRPAGDGAARRAAERVAALVPPDVGRVLRALVAGPLRAWLAFHLVDLGYEEIEADDAVLLRGGGGGRHQRRHRRIARVGGDNARIDVRPLAGLGGLVAGVVENRRRPALLPEVTAPARNHRRGPAVAHFHRGQPRARQARVGGAVEKWCHVRIEVGPVGDAGAAHRRGVERIADREVVVQRRLHVSRAQRQVAGVVAAVVVAVADAGCVPVETESALQRRGGGHCEIPHRQLDRNLRGHAACHVDDAAVHACESVLRHVDVHQHGAAFAGRNAEGKRVALLARDRIDVGHQRVRPEARCTVAARRRGDLDEGLAVEDDVAPCDDVARSVAQPLESHRHVGRCAGDHHVERLEFIQRRRDLRGAGRIAGRLSGRADLYGGWGDPDLRRGSGSGGGRGDDHQCEDSQSADSWLAVFRHGECCVGS